MEPLEDVERRTCWVCFATHEDDPVAFWVRPCRCRGTSKWVHQACLQRWIDEKQRGNSSVNVTCPQCNWQYEVVYPPAGVLVSALDLYEKGMNKVCPVFAGGVLIGSMYWTAVTYGALTVMQVLGHKEGMTVMENADPIFLLIGLPTIPMFLILGKMVRWEDHLLRVWRKYSSRIPLLKWIFSQDDYTRTPAEVTPASGDPVSFTRILCGALILPTMATIAGKAIFNDLRSNFQRSILGGATFTIVKGLFKIYYKQQQYQMQAHRQIQNYEEEAVPVDRP